MALAEMADQVGTGASQVGKDAYRSGPTRYGKAVGIGCVVDLRKRPHAQAAHPHFLEPAEIAQQVWREKRRVVPCVRFVEEVDRAWNVSGHSIDRFG